MPVNKHELFRLLYCNMIAFSHDGGNGTGFFPGIKTVVPDRYFLLLIFRIDFQYHILHFAVIGRCCCIDQLNTVFPAVQKYLPNPFTGCSIKKLLAFHTQGKCERFVFRILSFPEFYDMEKSLPLIGFQWYFTHKVTVIVIRDPYFRLLFHRKDKIDPGEFRQPDYSITVIFSTDRNIPESFRRNFLQ